MIIWTVALGGSSIVISAGIAILTRAYVSSDLWESIILLAIFSSFEAILLRLLIATWRKRPIKINPLVNRV